MNTSHFILLILVASLVGCGSNDRPETVPVKGRVTLDGSDWPTAGMIIFTPSTPAAGLPRRPGRAIFNRQGYFTATTFSEGDGLIPGEYRVAVYCGEPIGDIDGPSKGYVPAKYQSPASSGLKLSVRSGSSAVDVQYDISASPSS